MSGGVSNRLTSSRERAFGSVRPLLGRSIIAKGFRLTIFCRARKEKKVFRAEIRRALLRFEIDFRWQCSRKAWIKETSTLFRCLLPWVLINARKKVISAEYASILFSANRLSEMRWCKKRSRAALNCPESGGDIIFPQPLSLSTLLLNFCKKNKRPRSIF